MTERKTRQQITEQETWDTTDLFLSEDIFEKALATLDKDVDGVLNYKGKLATDEQHLLKAIQSLETVTEKIIQLSTYATLKMSADGSDTGNQTLYSKASARLTIAQSKLSFFEPELLTIPEDKLNAFIDREPALHTYEKMLEDTLAKGPFTLSAEIEEALASFGEVLGAPYMIYERSKSADFDFDSIQVDGGELPISETLYEDKYEMSANTEIRRKAYDSFTKTLNRYKHTFATAYQTEITKQMTNAKLRGYSSVTKMLLQDQHVSEEMYHNQLDIIGKELAPHMRRFAKLKQKVHKLDELHFSDLKTALDPTYNPKISFDEAKEMVIDGLSSMGEGYQSIIRKGLNERWVDYADNIGKQSGAFCASPYGSHPYILMTWTGQMRGVFTLAHELGHAGHFYLANENQTLFNTDVSTYFVEAPSTFNELLLAEHLLEKNDDKRMKRWVISQLMETYYHNFVTHLLEGVFQRRVYDLAEKGIPLTADVLCEQKKEVIQEFWGDTVKIDDGAGLTWMRQPHYYMGLYPYTYSAGLTVSTAVLQQMKQNEQRTSAKWMDVLKSGSTLSPLDLIAKADVDMLDVDTIKRAVQYVGSLVDQLEESYQ